ncbi:MAG: 4-(cytidine 5'-diphospho)-2-C-methyl-D-erythritol kinase [Chloroflexota bacterium]|nr:4-(cytidine 5'-diphospho)-2-C-methyl-D-erythritol kinase [Chloroflexota bacterium]
MITVSAFAKINLTLEVLGRRSDGYHDVSTILQEIDLKDSLSFEECPDITLDCDRPELKSTDNLVIEAARLLRKETGYRGGVRITLDKGIPVAAGLGGGSSDAAATLVALDELWGLNLSSDSLVELASQLGSDVPFFVRGGAALTGERGEKIISLPALVGMWVVLLKSAVPVPERKTRAMYKSLSPSHFSGGEHTKRMASVLKKGGGDLPLMYNAFDAIASDVYEGIEWYRERFRSIGAPEVHLAGSGPALFALLNDRGRAEQINRSLLDMGLESYIVRTVARS